MRTQCSGMTIVLIVALIGGPSTSVVAQSEGDAGYTSSRIDNLVKSRAGHSATLLPDERVAISGGGWADIEVFDPDAGTFERAGKMAKIRNATATLLPDGRVLLAGGRDPGAESVWEPRLRWPHGRGWRSGYRPR